MDIILLPSPPSFAVDVPTAVIDSVVSQMAKKSNHIILFETSLSSDSDIEIYLALLPEPRLLEDIMKLMEQIMTSDILFISKGSGKAIFITKRDVIIKSYCSLSSTCSFRDRCQSCDIIDTAKSYLMDRTSSSGIKTLDGELSAGIGEYKIGKKYSSGSYGPWVLYWSCSF